MKKKIISTLVAGAIICNVTPVFASTEVISEENKTENMIVEQEDSLEQLQWAIEEMSNAVEILDKSNLTDAENYEALIRFGTAALDRVRAIDSSNDSEAMEHIAWIEESGNKIRNATYSINRLLHAIDNVEIVFSPDRQDTVENMENVLNTLETVIEQEEESYFLNQVTIEAAKVILNNYWSIIPATPGGELPEIGVNPNQLTDEQKEELNYSIEEMRIAIDLLDNADMTVIDNYNRMIIFATASLDRVRGLNITNEYDDFMYVEDIERLGDEVRNATYSINSLLEAINKTVNIYKTNSHVDDIKLVLEDLDKTIKDETNNLNKATIDSAKELSIYYWSIIPATPGDVDDNMGVDEPLIPLEPSIPSLPLVPLEPSKPVIPLVPLDPSKPVTPLVPLEPSTPIIPLIPLDPSNPVIPLVPLDPSTPVVKLTELVASKPIDKTKSETIAKKPTLPNTGIETAGLGFASAITLLGTSLMLKRKSK